VPAIQSLPDEHSGTLEERGRTGDFSKIAMDGGRATRVCSATAWLSPHRRDVAHGVAVTVLLSVLLLPVLGTAGPPAESAFEVKTLDRLHDPVVVRTGALAGVPDRETARYRLYAARKGRLEPIPFQFDARGADGELVLSEDGAETDFTFDDDELVFMAKDTGDRVADTALPAKSDAALEIEVTDRSHTGRAWAYLVHFPGDPPPRSPLRYATFDSARQEARALSYQVSYSRDPSNFLSSVRIPAAAGGTGESVIARLNMRISTTFKFLFATFRPTFTEESFSVVPDGVKNGPVRAIRRVRQSLDLGNAFPEIPNGRVYTYYYASSFHTPSRFSIPWLVLKTLHDFRFESVEGFGTETDGMRYWDAANPGGVSFTGSDRPAAVDTDHDWWVVSGNRGTCLHTLVIPEEWREWGIKRGIVFRDGADDSGAGYSLLQMTHLQKPGAYELGSALVVMPRRYQPGDEAEALAGFRDPLQTEVRTVALDGGAVRQASAARAGFEPSTRNRAGTTGR
jgi:hypothetical protein